MPLMRRSWQILWLSAVLCLSGCASAPLLQPKAQPQPQLSRWQVNSVDDKEALGAPTLVVAVPDGTDWRWLWTDALGMPLAREVLHEGKWRADGLLPPNKMARPLFNALMVLSLDEAARERVFPSLRMMADNDEVSATLRSLRQFVLHCPRHMRTVADETNCARQGTMSLILFPSQSRYRIRKLP